MNFEKSMFRWPIVGVVTLGVAIVACSSDDTSDSGPRYDSTAAAVAGAPDTHCGGKVVTVSEAACKAAPAEEHGHDHADADADAAPHEHAATLFNSEGDDGDCKYHVKWTSGAVGEDADVYLQAAVTTKADGEPVAGAPVSAEVYLDETHPAPNSGAKTTETAPGRYVIGPIRFDAPGRWTVRFHIHGDCNDGETSPHGHVAFFTQVP
jgi:hypothetical protein